MLGRSLVGTVYRQGDQFGLVVGADAGALQVLWLPGIPEPIPYERGARDDGEQEQGQ